MSNRVTVGFVLREQFSTTENAIETLLRRTKESFDLVIVDSGSPPEVRDYLEAFAQEHQATLLRTEGFLTPNQSRNLVLRHATTPYVCFVDNDVRVAENWLGPLVDRAEREDAWVVAPLYCEHEPEATKIHMFGGDVIIAQDHHGKLDYHEQHDLAHEPIDGQKGLSAKQTKLVEFHTVLVRKNIFETIGPLDEQLYSNCEHADLCLQVTQAGGTIWLEPQSVITYIPPRSLTASDRRYFHLRWSQRWSEQTGQRMAEKYGISRNASGIRWIAKWSGNHRRYSMPRLQRLKRALPGKLGKRFEKLLIAPIENQWNRWTHRKVKPNLPAIVQKRCFKQRHGTALENIKAARALPADVHWNSNSIGEQNQVPPPSPQTNLQLYQLLSDKGFGENDVDRIRAAYGITIESFSDSFRADQRHFTSHLIGTAGALAKWNQPIELIGAGLLHSIYLFGHFRDGEKGTTPRRRKWLNGVVGQDIETIVYRYSNANWSDKDFQACVDKSAADQQTRELFILKLADFYDELDSGGAMCTPNKKLPFGILQSIDSEIRFIDGVKRVLNREIADHFSFFLNQLQESREGSIHTTERTKFYRIDANCHTLRRGMIPRGIARLSRNISKLQKRAA